jgi:hypothetical protein
MADSPPLQAVTTLENVLVFASRDPPSPSYIQSILSRRLGEMAATHPRGIAYVQAIHPGDAEATRRGLDSGTREAFLQMVRAHSNSVKAALVVLPVEGFVGAALRATVTGLVIASRTKVPMKVVPHLDDGWAWVASHLRTAGANAPPEAAVKTALERMRGEIGIR